METPSSTLRLTRSMTASKNIPMSRKKEEPEKVLSRSRKGKSDRLALLDMTNGSPIVGLAMGVLETPSSVAKNSSRATQTPESGEALLRGQVKTLLEKVEEDADLQKLSFDHRSFPHFQGLSKSPVALLAPTPANTPAVPNLSNGHTHHKANVLASTVIPVAGEEQDPDIIDKEDEMKQETFESHEGLITRTLLFESPGKSEISDSSTLASDLTFQGSCCDEKSEVDDDASVWSIQVNASSQGDEEGDIEDYEIEDVGGQIDELCEELEKVLIEEKKGLPEFTGRHTRFIYNSDDEIESEEEIGRGSSAASPSILCLKGMPMPEGKHLRFPEEEDH